MLRCRGGCGEVNRSRSCGVGRWDRLFIDLAGDSCGATAAALLLPIYLGPVLSQAHTVGFGLEPPEPLHTKQVTVDPPTAAVARRTQKSGQRAGLAGHESIPGELNRDFGAEGGIELDNRAGYGRLDCFTGQPHRLRRCRDRRQRSNRSNQPEFSSTPHAYAP